MNLSQEIQLRAADRPQTEILEAMGYQHPSAQTFSRLKAVVGSSNLGLDKGLSDFKYNSEAFALSLALALGIPEADAAKAISETSQYWFKEAWAFRPQLHAITGLKREGRSAMTMGHLLNQCQVALPDAIWHEPLNIQIKIAQSTVLKNVLETAGNFGSSGQAEKYRFAYEKNASLEISLEGEILGGVLPPEEIN
jgi:hypothetical protein